MKSEKMKFVNKKSSGEEEIKQKSQPQGFNPGLKREANGITPRGRT